jgi:hypothetical protein
MLLVSLKSRTPCRALPVPLTVMVLVMTVSWLPLRVRLEVPLTPMLPVRVLPVRLAVPVLRLR